MIFCLLFLFLSIFVLTSDARDIPDISGDTHNRILNMDNVLTTNAFDAAQNLLVSVEEEIFHDCGGVRVGYQIAAAVIFRLSDWKVARLAGGDAAYKMEVFTRAVHDQWGVGNLPCHDGTVLAFSVNDRQMYVSRGSGMEQILKDKYIDIVFERMRPYLQDRDYDRAIVSGILDLKTLIKQDKNSPEYKELMRYITMERIKIAAIVLCITIPILAIISCCFYDNWKKKRIKKEWTQVRRRLEQLEKLVRDHFPDGQILTISGPINNDAAYTAQSMAIAASSSTPSAPLLPSAHDVSSVEGKTPYQPLANQLDCCPVCFEDYTKNIVKDTRRCGHTFCKPCISTWLKNNSTCPLCRAEIRDVDTVPTNISAIPTYGSVFDGVPPIPSAPDFSSADPPSIPSEMTTHSGQLQPTVAFVQPVTVVSEYVYVDSREALRRHERELSNLLLMLTRRYRYACRRFNVTPSILYSGKKLSNAVPANLAAVNAILYPPSSSSGSSRSGRSGGGSRATVSIGRSFGGGRSSGGRGGSW